MKRTLIGLAAGSAAVLLAVIALSGCGKDLQKVILPNQLPEVQMTAAPIDTSGRYFYSYTINWNSNDPDGRVDHYLYAVDPPASGDTTWVLTRENEKRLTFTASQPDPQGNARARDFHVFAIKAVDDRGGAGPMVYRAFFSFTQAPVVTVVNPRPSRLITNTLPPSVRFTWAGNDPDGVFTTKPVKYKYILLGPGTDFKPETAESWPDSVRTYFAPTFAGWDSVGGDTLSVQYTNLTPNALYAFVVVAFDEAGAYSPVFSLDANILRFRVGFATAKGPKFTLFNEFFEFTQKSGSYNPSEANEFFIEVPSNQAFRVNWTAEPQPGAEVRAFRWAVDIQDLSDNTPRTDELTDLAHWSSPSRNVDFVTLGPYEGGQVHRLYIEAEDNTGLKSLAILRFLVVRATFDKELLIVDDTRLKPDGFRNNALCPIDPTGAWPSSAELDTFLFAKGGFPWRCYPGEPPTKPGVFAGYGDAHEGLQYPDTLNTRIGQPDLTVRLSKLSQYRHVVWVIDDLSAINARTGIDLQSPMTALRYMAGSNRVNTLGGYIRQGGRAWLMGGGGAMAVQFPWNDTANDGSGGVVFSITGARRELASGRFMYDIAHWQSSIRLTKERVIPIRYTGRFGDSAAVSRAGSPYATLPPFMETNATDPPPANRNPSTFYQTILAYEYMNVGPNSIVEDIDPSPDGVNEVSTLDTLYRVQGGTLPSSIDNPHNAVMTYYHGPQHPEFVFTGFTPWLYKRSRCIELVDFVLQNIWHLPRQAIDRDVPPVRSLRALAETQSARPLPRSAWSAVRGEYAPPKSWVPGRLRPLTQRLAPAPTPAPTKRD